MIDPASLLPLWEELSKRTGYPMGNFPGLYSAGLLRIRRENQKNEKERAVAVEYCENYLAILLASIGGKQELMLNNLNELGISSSSDLGKMFQAMINEGVLAERKRDHRKYFDGIFDARRLDDFFQTHLVREKAKILMKGGFRLSAVCGVLGLLGILYGLIFNMKIWILGLSGGILAFGILYLFSNPMVRTKRRFRRLHPFRKN